MAEEKQVHYVTVTAPTPDGESTAVFECRGDETSPCHQYPDCDCETWDDDHEHPKVTHTDCWLKDWFEAPGVGYQGEDCSDMTETGLPYGMNRSGFITTRFEIEYVLWEFAA